MRIDFLASLSEPISPDSTVIVFDLHNVVFKKQTRKIIMSCLRLIPRGTWKYTFNPALWYRVYRLRSVSHVAEDIFLKMTAHYPGLAPFRDDFIRLTNNQRPVRKVVDLIQSLKARGYKLYILSNIGRETFEQLAAQYPEISCHFDGAFTATVENNYSHKPQLHFYEQFKIFLHEQGHADKQILFIDDLKTNLIAAARCNIAGVQFTSSKRLEKTFKKLSVL